MRRAITISSTLLAMLGALFVAASAANAKTPSNNYIIQGSYLYYQAPDPFYRALVSTNGQYQARISDNSTFVVERVSNGQILAQFGTYTATPDTGTYLTFQSDGNVVLYRTGNIASWSTGTYIPNTPRQGGQMIMQDDGNLVVYSTPDSNNQQVSLWQSDTRQAPNLRHYVACSQEDGPGPCIWDGTVRGNGVGRSYIVTASGGTNYLNDTTCTSAQLQANVGPCRVPASSSGYYNAQWLRSGGAVPVGTP